ncbi:MAG: O-antigen ligase family protein [Solirubrobacterales bacterium]|nr:O-antigen ligase family protein [Solirubrobacterales bacterium]
MRSTLIRLQHAGVAALVPTAVFFQWHAYSSSAFTMAISAWALFLLGVALGQPALPRGAGSRIAIFGLLGLTGLSALSFLWAPDLGLVVADLTGLLLYSGFTLAATSALTTPGARAKVEPFVWMTIVVAAAYGLSERFFPGTFALEHSMIAFGRLSQPLGYWNAMGLLSGLGVVIASRLAADPRRSALIRLAAAASTPILIAALWLTFSRGALAATGAGLAAVVALRPCLRQIQSSALSLVTLLPVMFAADHLASVLDMRGSATLRASDGLIFLAAVVVTSLFAAAVHRASEARYISRDRPVGGKYLPRLAITAAVSLALMPALIVVVGGSESGQSQTAYGSTASRLKSFESNRSIYWNVALNQFTKAPLIGEGAGSFRTAWLEHREGRQPAQNAHSLELETLGELGLLGILLLTALLGGTWVASRTRRQQHPDLLIASCAGLLVFVSHSSIDWDWQLPGVVLPVLALVAALISTDATTSKPKSARVQSIALVAIAAVSILWLGHAWEAATLQREAAVKTKAADVLGWSPERYHSTVTLLKDASWLNPNPSPRYDLTQVYLENNHPREAARLARQTAEDNPGVWFAWAMVWQARMGSDGTYAILALVRSNQLRGGIAK